MPRTTHEWKINKLKLEVIKFLNIIFKRQRNDRFYWILNETPTKIFFYIFTHACEQTRLKRLNKISNQKQILTDTSKSRRAASYQSWHALHVGWRWIFNFPKQSLVVCFCVKRWSSNVSLHSPPHDHENSTKTMKCQYQSQTNFAIFLWRVNYFCLVIWVQLVKIYSPITNGNLLHPLLLRQGLYLFKPLRGLSCFSLLSQKIFLMELARPQRHKYFMPIIKNFRQ